MNAEAGDGVNAVLKAWPETMQRPMVAADLDAVLAIEVRAYSHPWTRGNFIDSLAAGYSAEVRVDGAGQVLGYSVAMPGVEETHLLNLSVAPEGQRQGHGTALLRRVAASARARGDLRLWLEVRASNDAGRGLYLAFGFVEVGLRRGYYPAELQRREDAVLMSLDLTVPGAAGGHALD